MFVSALQKSSRVVPLTRNKALLCVAVGTLIAASAGLALATGPGALDSRFGHGGLAYVGSNNRLFGAVVQRDGKVVVVGEAGASSSARLLLVRFTSPGRLDRSFGRGGLVKGPAIIGHGRDSGSLGRAVALQSDGGLVVVGKVTNGDGLARDGLLVERYDSRGRLDRSFGKHGVVDVLTGDSFGDGYAVAIQPDGKILAAGTSDRSGTGGVGPRAAIVRLQKNGRLDRSFGRGGIDAINLGPDSYPLAVALQRGGKIVIAGSEEPDERSPTALVARLTQSGALDRSFAGRGEYAHQYARGGSFSSFNALTVQPDGKILAAGSAVNSTSGADAIVVRFAPSGGRDRSFASGGAVYSSSAINFLASGTTVPGAKGITLGAGGRIIAAGDYANGVEIHAALWAFTSRGRPVRGFGSQGRVLTAYHSASESEAAGLAISPNGTLVTAGDGQTLPGRDYFAVTARYVGFKR